jgi:hypothetical protein
VGDNGLVVVNFAHPLTAEQRAQIEALTGRAVGRVIDVTTHVDAGQALAPQAATLADRVGLQPEEWQTMPLLVNPPGLACLSAALLAELHGRMGHFPTLARLRPVADVVPTSYEVAEVVNLQSVRDQARERRR